MNGFDELSKSLNPSDSVPAPEDHEVVAVDDADFCFLPNGLIERLAASNLADKEFKVLLGIIRVIRDFRWEDSTVMPLSRLCEITGIEGRELSNTLLSLSTGNVIWMNEAPDNEMEIRVNTDYETWEGLV